jgi:hypothetical protein
LKESGKESPMRHEMDQGSAILAIVIGSVAIVASFFVQNFYAAKGMYGELSDKQIPTRMGRLFFCVVGGMFILIGIMFFFPNQ